MASFDTRALITAVHDNPCLWRHSNSDYMNKEVRDKAWEEVAKRIIPDWNEVTDKQGICNDLKRKWANIRDCYRKEIHRNRRAGGDGGGGGSGGGGVDEEGGERPGGGESEEEGPKKRKKREYIFADMLTFLRPVLKRRTPTFMKTFMSSRGGEAVAAESTEEDAGTTEDSCTSQQPSTRADAAGVSTSVPVVWVRSLQDHAPPLTISNSPFISNQHAAGGSEGDDGRPRRPRRPQQNLLVRATPTSSTSLSYVSAIPPVDPMSAPPDPPTIHPPFHTQQHFHPLQQQYQQHPQYQPLRTVYAMEQDPDLSFLISLLPDIKTMSELQKMDFKIGMMKLMKDIKFPGVLPSGSSASVVNVSRQMTHSGGHGVSNSGGQEVSANPRPKFVYITPDTHNEYGGEEEACDSETTVKTE